MPSDPTSPAPRETQILDATGLRCPLPVLKARKALESLAPGEVLLVQADDPIAPIDFEHFCNETAYLLESKEAQTDGGFLFRIRKPE